MDHCPDCKAQEAEQDDYGGYREKPPPGPEPGLLPGKHGADGIAFLEATEPKKPSV